jgi:hypothetical protein
VGIVEVEREERMATRTKDIGSGSLRFAMDYVAFDYHNDTYSHIDAPCHVAFERCLYNGHPAAGITSRGAAVHGIEALKDGLVGRGVLLDIPRLRGASWLEPGEYVFGEELQAAERAQEVTVADGDILLVRTGHPRRLAELGPWDTAAARAGLHPTAMAFVAERRVAALGDLGRMCETAGRWEFLFMAAPLRIVGGTGNGVAGARSPRLSIRTNRIDRRRRRGEDRAATRLHPKGVMRGGASPTKVAGVIARPGVGE